MFGHANPTPFFRFTTCVVLCLALSQGLALPGYAQTVGTPIGETQAGADRTNGDAYEFGPMDQIQLRVVIWDNNALTFRNLEVVSGTYGIGTDGRVMLPIIGGVAAAGTRADDLADDIAEALKERMGSREAPSVAIEIASYRPVFVLGDVARPGEYAFRPGMRAIQLLAQAGGYYRLSEAGSGRLEQESLNVTGNLRELDVNLATLHVRKARLEAESADRASFDLPDGVTHPGGPDSVNAILAREREIYETQLESHALQVESLQSSRALLVREVSVLTQKLEAITRQVNIMAEAVGNLESLLARGLTRSPTLLNSQRALFDLEARELDAENQIFRATQSLQEVERTLNETIQKKTRENLTQLQSINTEIDQLLSRRETQRGLLSITQQASLLMDTADTDAPVPVFRIARDVGGAFVSETVSPDAILRPLDTLEISLTDNEVSPSN
jgi:protein involved in polysaccharide export with SLBB domain/chaperonin cofactor prefoldin